MRQLRPAVVAVAAVVALVAVAAAPAPAAAQALEAFEWRTVLFGQGGHGYQSQDGADGEPGSQQAIIVEPLLWARLRQTPTLVHEAAVEVDIVSAASPDAIDATTSASRMNESVALDVTHRWAHDHHGEVQGRWGFHAEEPLRSWFWGAGYVRKLADDNFTLTVNGVISMDWFDSYGPYGDRPGLKQRHAYNGNLSVSQVLSPTTILDAAYGATFQAGLLETTWNAVPMVGGGVAREKFPGTRLRQAATVRVSQHLPRSHTTVKASYRIYHDDFDLDAHTVQLFGYQYVTPWLYARLGYRVHHQDGASFYMDVFPDAPTGYRTSDSDLAPFTAHEVTAKLALLADRAPFAVLGRANLDVVLGHYRRSNDLSITWGALSLGYKF